MTDQERRGRIVKWFWSTLLLGALCAGRSDADAPSASGKIFRCQTGQQLVFTDRVCGSAEQSEEIVLPSSNTYRPEPILKSAAMHSRQTKPATSPATSKPNRASRDSIAAEQLRDKQRCLRLADQLDTIEAKMRAGYTVRQGEQLRERRREVERRRHAEQCR